MTKRKIVVSLLTKDQEFQVMQAADAERAAARAGFDIEVVYANNNTALQQERAAVTACSRMRSDRDDRQHLRSLFSGNAVRAVVEKDPVRAWRPVLRIGFEDLLATRAAEGGVRVGVQRWVPKVRFQQAQGLLHLLQDRHLVGSSLQRLEVRLGLRREAKLTIHSLSARVANEPITRVFPEAA